MRLKRQELREHIGKLYGVIVLVLLLILDRNTKCLNIWG